MSAIANLLRLVIARTIGGLIATLSAWLMIRYGIIVDDSAQAELTSNVVAVMMTIFTILYPLIHKLINRKINPGDAASSHLAREEKTQAEGLRDLDS